MLKNIKTESVPSYDYIIDFENGTLKTAESGTAEIEQAVRLRLLTEQNIHKIYSSGYGLPKYTISAATVPYVYVEIKNRIRECLCEDDRISDVYGFSFYIDNDSVYVYFTVKTVEGEIAGGVKI